MEATKVYLNGGALFTPEQFEAAEAHVTFSFDLEEGDWVRGTDGETWYGVVISEATPTGTPVELCSEVNIDPDLPRRLGAWMREFRRPRIAAPSGEAAPGDPDDL